MKKFASIVFIVTVLFSVCSCSFNEKKGQNNVSVEAQAIMESLKPDERIDDYLIVNEILLKNTDNKQETKTDLKKLIEIYDKYEVSFKENTFSPNFDLYLEDLDNNQSESLDERKEKYNYNFFRTLVIPVYYEKKAFETFLPTSFVAFKELSNSLGYVYEQDQTVEDYSKKYYQNKTEDSFKGDYTIVHYDHLGNVGDYFFRLKYNGEGFTAQQLEDLAKQDAIKIVKNDLGKLNIKNNLFLKLTYDDEEINKIQSMFSNMTEEWLKANNLNELSDDTFNTIMCSVIIGDTTLTFMGDATSDVSIAISTKDYYYDKYHNELKILEHEYTKSTLSEEQPLLYKTIDEVLNELPVSETIENESTETTNTDVISKKDAMLEGNKKNEKMMNGIWGNYTDDNNFSIYKFDSSSNKLDILMVIKGNRTKSKQNFAIKENFLELYDDSGNQIKSISFSMAATDSSAIYFDKIKYERLEDPDGEIEKAFTR